jgi:osmotically-inducible protein OsmY
LTPSSEEIKKNVVDQLFWDSRVDASDILVEVSDGSVTLLGHVPSHVSRHAAEADAWTVPGVTWVDNQISVLYPASYSLPTDHQIKNYIQGVLAVNREVGGAGVDVEVRGGVATIQGTVDTYWKKTMIERMARDVVGVVDVESKLTIVPSGSIRDQAIAEGIAAAMERNTLIDSGNVDIKVTDGHVTLTGTVSHWRSMLAAEETAGCAAGVRKVDNLLTLRP